MNCKDAANQQKNPVLKQIFDMDAERITSDELQQIIAPVLKKIGTGELEATPKKRGGKRSFLPYMAVLAAMVAIVVLTRFYAGHDTMMNIPSGDIPLGASASLEYTLFGRITGAEAGAELTLVDTEAVEVVAAAMAGNDGTFSFTGVADGRYQLIVELSANAQLPQSLDGGIWAVYGGEVWQQYSGDLIITLERK